MSPMSDTEREERIRLHASGLTDSEIARLLRKNQSSISEWRRNHGISPNAKRGKIPRPTHERFWERVMRSFETDCWGWKGATTPWGYGCISDGKNQRGAHCVSWELHNGPIPEGMWVLHKCDNPPCTNPDHLRLGTAKDNTQDMLAKGRGRHQIQAVV